MLSIDSESVLSDLRITRVRSTKHDLNLLLQCLSKSSVRLTRLRLSHISIDDFILTESLKHMVNSMP